MRGGVGESGVWRALRALRGWKVERTRVEEREEETEMEMERLFADEEFDDDDGGAVLRRV